MSQNNTVSTRYGISEQVCVCGFITDKRQPNLTKKERKRKEKKNEPAMVAIKLLRNAHRLELPKGAKQLSQLALGRLKRHVAHNQLGAVSSFHLDTLRGGGK